MGMICGGIGATAEGTAGAGVYAGKGVAGNGVGIGMKQAFRFSWYASNAA
jgi:hypothetical protein